MKSWKTILHTENMMMTVTVANTTALIIWNSCSFLRFCSSIGDTVDSADELAGSKVDRMSLMVEFSHGREESVVDSSVVEGVGGILARSATHFHSIDQTAGLEVASAWRDRGGIASASYRDRLNAVAVMQEHMAISVISCSPHSTARGESGDNSCGFSSRAQSAMRQLQDKQDATLPTQRLSPA
ncbi:hypothetical protein J6590_007433 [Homalodisca vitripennis]|nr:hypothetical protein J6590_007427 [Homalodisca vitripennis]KAG8298838.1 hypothetical protein J6590_007433 [Homalodisca vitripennis]